MKDYPYDEDDRISSNAKYLLQCINEDMKHLEEIAPDEYKNFIKCIKEEE